MDPPSFIEDVDSSSEATDILDLKDDEGWQDVEPDYEVVRFICPFEEESFSTVDTMLQHCIDTHDFDLAKVRHELDLDFLETVKLVNYVRSEATKGNEALHLNSKHAFDHDHYLQPVLKDDALLYNLDDVCYRTEMTSLAENAALGVEESGVEQPFSDLSVEAHNTEAEAKEPDLQERFDKLQQEFKEYRDFVERVISGGGTDDTIPVARATTAETDKEYFDAYSGRDIHETMLKDKVRTDAYQDFIYGHKDAFAGKTVLDVGCGTGILSMFCARAGAREVIAVDNSDMINKARENVFKNGFQNVIRCIHGKIEEVPLPVSQVDIIISEWMGYCLLYENMLESVLWARDRYLAPDGLMIPSHTTLYIAPLSDPKYISEHVTYWHSVYNFDMTSMLPNIYDNVEIKDVNDVVIPAGQQPFLRLSMYSATNKDLTFTSKAFQMELKEDIDVLDGFVIWFDTFFMLSRAATVSEHAKAEDWGNEYSEGLAFTTGPGGEPTHWQQGVLYIDRSKVQAQSLKEGQVIVGEIEYRKRASNRRELDIELKWEVSGTKERGKQLWKMC